MIYRLIDVDTPDNWEKTILSNIATIKMGQSPPSSSYNKKKEGLPFFQGNNDFGYIHPSASIWCTDPKREAIPNDILISVRAPVGEINITDQICCIGRGLAAIEVKHQFSYKYIFFALNHYKKIFRRIEQGSTFTAINKADLLNFPLLLPKDTLVQQKIATILSNVDDIIQKTQKLIEKLQLLKKGLMQRLFTEGIGHTEFKDTKLGRIPKEWEIVRIKDVGKVITGRTPSTKKPEYWESNQYPFITPGDIKSSFYVRKSNRFVSEKGAKLVGLLPEKSVLTVCIGSTIGKVALNSFKCITNQQINALICNDRIDPLYICAALMKRSEHLKLDAGVAAVPIVKKSLFESFKIPLPNYDEQKEISSILNNIEEKITNEELYVFNLSQLKKGLMQQLLTGKKRVSVK